MRLSLSARAFITLVIVLGLCVAGNALVNANAETVHWVRLAAFVVVACLAARLKVKLPGVTGSMSVNLPFILIAAAETGMVEALIVACLSNLMQCLPRDNQKFNLLRTVFNVCNMALAVEVTHLLYTSPELAGWVASSSLRLAVAAAGFFLVNTIPVAMIIVLTEGQNASEGQSSSAFARTWRTWLGITELTFPYFLASTGVAATVVSQAAHEGWLVPAAILPVMLALFWSYRRIFSASARLSSSDAPRKGVQSATEVGDKAGAALA